MLEACAATPAGSSRVLCSNWEEPRQRRTGWKYDRRTVARETREKPPPEAPEMKKGGAAPRWEQREVQGGICSKEKVRLVRAGRGRDLGFQRVAAPITPTRGPGSANGR
ncbi:hypothetical protein TcG_00221 [Trypanosoma cruzi]|nr:hypothetical protein TcG_00221 [Trypanosoma cruzi]